MSEQSNYDKYAGPVAGALIIWMLVAVYPATTIGSYVGHVTGDDAYGILAFIMSVAALSVIKIILESVDTGIITTFTALC